MLFGTTDEWLQSNTAANERPPSVRQHDSAASKNVFLKTGVVVTLHEVPYDSAEAGAWRLETEIVMEEARRYEVSTFP